MTERQNSAVLPDGPVLAVAFREASAGGMLTGLPMESWGPTFRAMETDGWS
jgi:hypothetical protein